MQYHFVIYGVNGMVSDFADYALSDLQKLPNVELRSDPFHSNIGIMNYLYKLHTYPYLYKYMPLPFRSIWNKYCHSNIKNEEDKLCFIFIPKYFDHIDYFEYLRKKYNNCKLVMLFRDKVDFYKRRFPRLSVEKIRSIFDLIYSYDKNDCKKYEFKYFNIEASKQDITPDDKSMWSDVVFIGTAKNRIDKIIDAYNLFYNAGLKTDFYIVGAKKEDRFEGEGIVFSDKLMSYGQMLKRTINSRCVLEISQLGEYGFTSRAQEAIMYNKKLITDSKIVKDQRFYPSPYICFYESINEIPPMFPKDDVTIDYGYKDDYSPIKLLEQIEGDLISLKS